MHAATRQRLATQFNREDSSFYLLISTSVGGTGLNLTGTNKVVVFDLSWSPVLDSQAIDRTYRIYQTRVVRVYGLIGAGALEKFIYGRQGYKSQAANRSRTDAKQKKCCEEVEGIKSEQGKLFRAKNLLTFQRSVIEGAIVREYNAEETTDADDEGLWQLALESSKQPLTTTTMTKTSAALGCTPSSSSLSSSKRMKDAILRHKSLNVYEHQKLFALTTPSKRCIASGSGKTQTRSSRERESCNDNGNNSDNDNDGEGEGEDEDGSGSESVGGDNKGREMVNATRPKASASSAIPWPPLRR